MSWAEVRKFINSGQKPLNELFADKENRDAIYAQIPSKLVYLSKPLVSVTSVVPVNVTGAGRLFFASYSDVTYRNSNMSLIIEVDGKKIVHFTRKNSSSSADRSLYVNVMKPIVTRDGASVSVSPSGTQFELSENEQMVTEGSNTYYAWFPIGEYVQFEESLKITLSATATSGGLNAYFAAEYSLE